MVAPGRWNPLYYRGYIGRPVRPVVLEGRRYLEVMVLNEKRQMERADRILSEVFGRFRLFG